MVRKIIVYIFILGGLSSYSNAQTYDELVQFSESHIDGEKIYMLSMNRKGQKVKCKYFAKEDLNGNSVQDRYVSWANGRKIIAVSSGTYMNSCTDPNPDVVGLTIDNGVNVNSTVESFDGLVIVYATGGVVASNIKEGNLSIQCNGANNVFDIRNSWQASQFISCAESADATVFQTHLLVWKDEFKIYGNADPKKDIRRFLAVCKDENGDVVHLIIHFPDQKWSLKRAAEKAFEFLKGFKDMEEVIFMVNLDTGCQNVFAAQDKNNNWYDITGTEGLNAAANLLVYYYE